jgi:putative phosphoribosyl transferase
MLVQTQEIGVPVGNYIRLKGTLNVPDGAGSLVIFSHGSGSSRHSVRNRYVAEVLNKEKIATLLIDLLTAEEDATFENRFDIHLLAERLVTITSYVHEIPKIRKLPFGYFGASTGAASALTAAGELDGIIHAIVCRGGRPDLAMRSLPLIKVPTLMIVGSLDKDVLELNRKAYTQLDCEKRMEIIEGASHLFEEPGKLEQVAQLAAGWFKKHINRLKIRIHAVQG